MCGHSPSLLLAHGTCYQCMQTCVSLSIGVRVCVCVCMCVCVSLSLLVCVCWCGVSRKPPVLGSRSYREAQTHHTPVVPPLLCVIMPCVSVSVSLSGSLSVSVPVCDLTPSQPPRWWQTSSVAETRKAERRCWDCPQAPLQVRLSPTAPLLLPHMCWCVCLCLCVCVCANVHDCAWVNAHRPYVCVCVCLYMSILLCVCLFFWTVCSGHVP